MVYLVKEVGTRVDPSKDVITVDGKGIKVGRRKSIYIIE